MTTTEDRARAAMRAIAGTVHDAPPLRLEPAADELWSPQRAPRRVRLGPPPSRWRSWLAPVTVAAVVVTLAIALVIIRDLRNGGAVPPSPATSTGPGGIPRYYVAVNPTSSKSGAPNGLLVGDSLTGKVIATLAPPTGTSFESVSGAADDRTFVALDLVQPTSSASGQSGAWFEVKLAPGTAHPATMTRLPIESRYPDVVASALSGSGQELAVAGDPAGNGEQGVEIFSLASGRLLHDWTANDSTGLVPGSWTGGVLQFPVLTWIDGDRAIAFTTISPAAQSFSGTSYDETVRRLNVGGPRGGDLMADSQVIWSMSTPDNSTALACTGTPPLVSADGKTVSCFTLRTQTATATGASWTMTFRTYHLSARTTGAGPGTVVCQITWPMPGSGIGLTADLWTSPSGSTLIGEWAVGSGTSATATPGTSGTGTSSSASVTLTDPTTARLRPAHIGVISHGKFTPLRLPPGFFPVRAPGIAW